MDLLAKIFHPILKALCCVLNPIRKLVQESKLDQHGHLLISNVYDLTRLNLLDQHCQLQLLGPVASQH